MGISAPINFCGLFIFTTNLSAEGIDQSAPNFSPQTSSSSLPEIVEYTNLGRI